ncbi:hypothetical protein I315_00227 [Cryptococcus gattii Ru294]|nr:hypothetical protein I315_00227 [Cryptococcus gattii Ru294]
MLGWVPISTEARPDPFRLGWRFFERCHQPDIWEHEVRLDGYGSGSFQWTTASSNNSYIQDGILYIVPTLTSDHLGEAAITNGYTLNLTADGTSTSKNVSQCVAVSNSSLLTVINPVQTARPIRMQPQSNTVKWR